jgi:hypothetical protein
MGLYFFSGPKWEDDSLNDINEESLISNLKDWRRKRIPWDKRDDFGHLPAVIYDQNTENLNKKETEG